MTPYFPLARSILPHRRRGRGFRFLIHWEGFPYSHDSQLPGSIRRDLAALHTYLHSNHELRDAFPDLPRYVYVYLPWNGGGCKDRSLLGVFSPHVKDRLYTLTSTPGSLVSRDLRIESIIISGSPGVGEGIQRTSFH
ncbi:hypothetical protein BD309DRAFT_867441 [Dichomitus squalens]|nr:hypothetical protein BD309DRAFT_867441 [Dichomitus squalens]